MMKENNTKGNVSYKNLWKLLVDMDLSKQDFRKTAGISTGVMTKLNNGEAVSMDTLHAICKTCNCNIGDICEFTDLEGAIE